MPLVFSTIWCVTADIWSINDVILVNMSMVLCMSLACLSMSAIMFSLYLRFRSWLVLPRLIWAGMVLNLRGLPFGRVIAWTLPMPGTAKTALAILSITRKSAELRRS